MNQKQLIKIIDTIVKKRLKEALNSDEVKKVITEEAKNQLIKILLENKVEVNKNENKVISKNSHKLTEILNANKKTSYPKIKNNVEEVQKDKIINKTNNRAYTRDPILNKILNETPYVPENNYGFTGNALMDMGGSSLNESVNYATSLASSLGAKIDINPNAKAENIIPQNTQLFSNKKTPQIKEYKDSDGLLYVDERSLFTEEQIPVMRNPIVKNNEDNLIKAFTKNYSTTLKKMDEKAQKFRNVN